MPAPTITPLPIAPARLSKPNSFVTEAVIFLESLPTFRTQANQLSSYLNSQIPSKYSFGVVNGVRSFPDIFQTDTGDIKYDGDSIVFTSSLDTFYGLTETYSYKINNAGIWYDQVVSENGVIPFDSDKPLISGITYPMTRTQGRTTFNDTASLLTSTIEDNINSLYQSVWYTYLICCGDKDAGLITDAVDFYQDAGSITDTTITY